jgi:hypothetical protein
MVNRVLLNTSGLKVSKPGADVLSAGPGDLLFSSDWSALGLFTQGSISASWSTNLETGWWVQSVPFGKTFATPPAVFFEIDVGGNVMVPMGDTSGFIVAFQGNPADRFMWVATQVTTTGINFIARYFKDGWAQPALTVRYTVLFYDL